MNTIILDFSLLLIAFLLIIGGTIFKRIMSFKLRKRRLENYSRLSKYVNKENIVLDSLAVQEKLFKERNTVYNSYERTPVI